MFAIGVVVDQCSDETEVGDASLQFDGACSGIRYRKDRKGCETSGLRALADGRCELVVTFLTALSLRASCKM